MGSGAGGGQRGGGAWTCGWVVAVALLVGACMLALLLPPAQVVHAATVSVANCNDSGNGSLRAVIGSAQAGDTITFATDCPTSNPIKLTSVTLTVNRSVTIDGTGHRVVIDGNCTTDANSDCTSGGHTVFSIEGGTVTLRALTIQHGNTIGSFGGGPPGGGILNDYGTVTVVNSTVVHNHASGGGGGIANNDITTMTITNSTIANNTALTGGGINNPGTMTIKDSTISNNNPGGSIPDGGGIYNTGALNVTNTLIVNSTGGDENGLGITGTDTNNLTGTFAFANGETTPTDHGGPTPTLAIPTPTNPTSADAYQGGNLAACNAISPPYDQRGAARVVAGKCSVGAFEPGLVNTATALTANPTTASFGTSVTFTASISGVRGGTPPDGPATVTFTNNGTVLGTGDLVGGKATFATSGLSPGNSVTAMYTAGGAGNLYAASPASNAVSVMITPLACMVTSTQDATDPGKVTLRDAVALANAGACTGNTITFDPTVFAAAQTITLLAASGGTLIPTHSVTIDGTGRGVTISGGGSVGLFSMGSGVTVTLQALTLSGGFANTGGAVANTGGTLAVVGCTLSGNTANGANGGAILNTGGTLTVTGSAFAANHATNNGGAIFSSGGTAKVVNSAFSGNTATQGGAIANTGTLAVVGSTLSGNGSGATNLGGGIYNPSPGTLALALSVVAGNTTSGPAPDLFSASTITDGGGNVVGTVGSFAPGLTAPSDRLNVAPLLATLALNAPGATQTFALLPGSPAIDILTPCPTDPIPNATLATDARGITRPQGSACDSGSFESRGFTTSAPTGNNQSALVNTAYMNPVGLTVSSANSEPVSGGQVTFTITPRMGGASAAFGTAMGCTVSMSNTVAVCTVSAMGNATSPGFTANGTAGGFSIIATASGIATPFTFTETNSGVPQTFVVNRAVDDKSDAVCQPLAMTGCTLREAVNASNANDPGAGNHNTITFDAATNGATTALSVGVDITQNVTITGNGATNTQITYTGAFNGTLTLPPGSESLTLSGVTLSGGSVGLYTLSSGALSVSDSIFTGSNLGLENTDVGSVTVNRTRFDSLNAVALYALGTGPVTVTNSVFANSGNGLESANSGTVVAAGDTFVNNGNDLYGLGNGIIVSDTVLAGTTVHCTGTITDRGYNFAYGNNGPDTTCTSFTQPTSHRDRNPLLAPIGTNGVQTFALLPGSPAIDTGICTYTDAQNNPQTLATDARNVTRPQPMGGVCDSGSFESRGFTTGTPTGNNQTAAINTAYMNPVGLTVSDANTEPVSGGQVTFTVIPGMSGASAAFAGGGTTATGTIGSMGMVSSPGFTANGTVGGFTITATASGIATPFTFTEMNTPALAPLAFVVNRAADDKSDALCQPLAMAGCTLREAVNASNLNDPGAGNHNTITFDAATNGQTTTLPAEIDITQSVTITGNGAMNTLIAYTGNVRGALTVQGSAALTLSGVAISGGYTSLYTLSSGALSVTDSIFIGSGIDTVGSGSAMVNRVLFKGILSDAFSAGSSSTHTIINSTFSGNASGVSSYGSSSVVIVGSTFSGNRVAAVSGSNGSSLTVTDSILTASTGVNCTGAITDGGHNLAYGTSGAADTSCPATFTRNADPKLAPLGAYAATNGIQTFALLPGSPAIDGGVCAYTDAQSNPQTLTTDARNVGRPQGSACDSGSYESRGFTFTATSGGGQSALVNAAFTQPLIVTLAETGGAPLPGASVTFTAPAMGASATFTGSPATTNASGAAQVTARANGTAGGYMVSAAVGGGVAPVSFSLTNIATAATHFSVTGFPSPITAGMSGSVTVTALDATNAATTGYSGTVTITSSDPAAILPANATLTNGVGSFAVTLKTAGTQSITATDTVTASITGQQTGIVVTPAAAVSFTVAGFPSPVAAGTAGTITVTAKDASGNVATGYTGTVKITSSDAAAILPMNATLTNGVGTFSVTLNTAGTQSITATDTVTASVTGAQTGITVTAATVRGSSRPRPVAPAAATAAPAARRASASVPPSR